MISKPIAFLLSLLTFTACDVGFDNRPSGTPSALIQKLGGMYQVINDQQEQLGFVRITPEDNAAFSALYFEHSDEPKADEMNVRGTSVDIGRNHFISAQLISKTGAIESGMYMLVRYENTEPNKITVWAIAHEAMKDAVTRGKVKANFEESSVGEKIRVTSTADDVAAFIGADAEKLFTRKYTLKLARNSG